ncbi:hypothetical protein HDU91_006207, partial [Kappamyces sp. JEL0680]
MQIQQWKTTKLSTSDLSLGDATLDSELLPGQALVKHISAVICFTDYTVVTGTYFRSKSFGKPVVPGYSFLAEIVAVKPGIQQDSHCPTVAAGDIVAVMLSHSGWQTHSIIEINNPKTGVVPLSHPLAYQLVPPAGSIGVAQATAAILNGTTAYELLYRTGASTILDQNPTGSVLVHSAAGSVGSFLLQILRVKYPQAKVYGTCSAEKFDSCTRYGCEPIDYKSQDVRQVLRNKSICVAFDAIGGESFTRSRSVLGRGGILVMYGNTAGSSIMWDV